MQFPWMEAGPSPGPQAEGRVCVSPRVLLAEGQALGCTQVQAAQGTKCSHSAWEGALPQMAAHEKEVSIAPLLCLRQPCCSRGMITELDSTQEGI